MGLRDFTHVQVVGAVALCLGLGLSTPARAKGGELRLDTTVKALASRSAQKPLDALRKRIERHGMVFTIDPIVDSKMLPTDPFLGTVAERVAGQAETRHDSGTFASALAHMVTEVSDKAGKVNVAAFSQRYGTRATRLVSLINAHAARHPDDTANVTQRIERYADARTQESLESLTHATEPAMASFDSLVKSTSVGAPLAGMKLIAIQHVLGSTGSLMGGLVAAGMKPQDMMILTKRYSQQREVVTTLRKDGFQVNAIAQMEVGAHSNRVGDDDSILRALRRMVASSPSTQRFVLLDDGGRLIRMVNEHMPQLASRFVAVEQTRHGIMELEGQSLKLPVVNVAESWGKKNYEAPLIGRSVGLAVEQKLSKLRAGGVEPGKQILVLGYGTIGRATAHYFRSQGYSIAVYDPSPDASKNAKADGATVYDSLNEALAQGHIVVSMSGRTTIDRGNVQHLPNNAVLFNGASSDTEIDPHLQQAQGDSTESHDGFFTDKFAGKHVEVGSAIDPVRQDMVLQLGPGKQALLANRGNVINFTGDTDPIPPRYIQLTRSLLYLGVLQAAKSNATGFVPLDEAPQKALVSAIQNELADTHESLLTPTFN